MGTFETELEHLRGCCMTRAARRWALIKLCAKHGVKLYWISSRTWMGTAIADCNGFPRVHARYTPRTTEEVTHGML